uniref:Ferritin n=1 Tax=Oryzias latipes TaxID=8090 RepID=A0A3B3H2V6_ORYLA
MESQVRQNYHRDCEAAINRMVNMELFASYTYTSMAFYFDRDDVALPGFSHFFKENSHEEKEHADKLLSFQNKRGGRIFLQDVKKPERDEWGSGLEAMQCALQLEKNVNQALLDLHKVASDRNDPHVGYIQLLPPIKLESEVTLLNICIFSSCVTSWRLTT